MPGSVKRERKCLSEDFPAPLIYKNLFQSLKASGLAAIAQRPKKIRNHEQ